MKKIQNVKEYVEKIDSAKKVNPKDLSSDQDLTIGIMNLISIEEHLMFSGAKTGKTSYYDLIEQVREIRKQLMQKVIHKDMEPITPFIERMQYFYKKFGISTVLVAGSSGAYFQVADVIVQMDRYQSKRGNSRISGTSVFRKRNSETDHEKMSKEKYRTGTQRKNQIKNTGKRWYYAGIGNN